jgi:hypothetical protein
MSQERDVIVKVLSSLAAHLESAASEIREALGELAPEQAIPRIDLDDLDKAGWLTYRTKAPAEPGKPAWMKNPTYFKGYETPQVVFELVKALKRTRGEKLVLGDMIYEFSGNGKFISRKPVKVRSQLPTA